MGKKIGVLLAGCGSRDGSEIHEATLTLYFLDRAGVEAVCIAPDWNQYHVVNHINFQETEETRNIIVESARIARGKIRNLNTVSSKDLDGLILPGGTGAAKNWADYAIKKRNCSIHEDVKHLILDIVKADKPLGAICIAPMIVAVALRDSVYHPILTIGTDQIAASDLEYFGARHQNADVDEIVIDEQFKIVSTPAYMLGPGISDIAKGIEKLVEKVVELI
ncbi:isoprenoid biosynthesis glyoxalase ElbB [bacterium]